MRYIDERDPDYADRKAERRAEAREDGEPVTESDWDKLEAGPLWNSYPGMGAA